MKIAIDVSQMCYEGTGVARYVKGLTEALLNSNSPHEFVSTGTLRQRSFYQQAKPHPGTSYLEDFPLYPKLAVPKRYLDSFELLTGAVDLSTSDWSQPSAKPKCRPFTTWYLSNIPRP
jgi:hypothetical protein